jgi:hypothetical protein
MQGERELNKSNGKNEDEKPATVSISRPVLPGVFNRFRHENSVIQRGQGATSLKKSEMNCWRNPGDPFFNF